MKANVFSLSFENKILPIHSSNSFSAVYAHLSVALSNFEISNFQETKLFLSTSLSGVFFSKKSS